jgi:hypothetical protein
MFRLAEVIVATHPPGRSNWLERDVIRRAGAPSFFHDPSTTTSALPLEPDPVSRRLHVVGVPHRKFVKLRNIADLLASEGYQ